MTLVEMLTVMAVIALLLVLLVPTVGGVGEGYQLTRQAQVINDQLLLARQRAATRQRDVEFRLIRLRDTGGDGAGWSIQLWEANPATGGIKAVGRRIPFNSAIGLHSDLSPLLAQMHRGEDERWEWAALRFRANGRPAISLSMEDNYLTLRPIKDLRAIPANYCTLQIHPLSGHIAIYRP